MGQKQKSAWCVGCDKQVRAIAVKPNHLLHFVITVVTVGVWGIVWLLVVVGKIGNYRCHQCGRRV